MSSKNDGYSVVSLGFNFTYFKNVYDQVSISSNGYVCLGNNQFCDQISRPSPYEILVGLNYDLDLTKNESGQIYYQHLSEYSMYYRTAKEYVNRLDARFVPTNIFMITYDQVMVLDQDYRVSFQIFLSTNSITSYVTFKYISCPIGIKLNGSSGLNYKTSDNMQEIIIVDGQQCKSSNVDQKGVWVSEVRHLESGK